MAPHASPFHVPSLQENKDEYHDKWREKAMATQAELLRKYNKHAAKFRRKKGVKKKAVVVQHQDSDEESESESDCREHVLRRERDAGTEWSSHPSAR